MKLLVLAESSGRENNFNLLRVLAAIAVLFSHCFPLTRGPEAAEPLNALLGHSLGKVAVLIFFVISGFFVSQSFHRCASLSDFIAARVLRIYPGFIVVLVFGVVVIGAMTTAMPVNEYYSDPSTFIYVLNGLTLKWIQVGLPGVFLTNPYPFAVNGSLWTLFYEVLCYAGAVVVALFIKASSRRRFFAFSAFWAS
jgi:peptidoglycan/LPS O-acetylase OafA/YrhL